MSAALLANFTKLVGQEAPPCQKSLDVLAELRLATLDFQFIFAEPTNAAEQKQSDSEKKIVMSMLESSVLLAAKLGNWREENNMFENSYSQLKTFYTDQKHIVDQDKKNEIFGLNLLRLLIKNNLMKFHMELELLTDAERVTSPIAFVVALEQALAEGSYHKVLSAEKNVPVGSFKGFIPFLKDAVRADVANCSEKAYSSLSVKDAQEIMFFDSEEQLKTFVNDRPAWSIQDGRLMFQAREAAQVEIPSMRLISQSLSYANELERIV